MIVKTILDHIQGQHRKKRSCRHARSSIKIVYNTFEWLCVAGWPLLVYQLEGGSLIQKSDHWSHCARRSLRTTVSREANFNNIGNLTQAEQGARRPTKHLESRRVRLLGAEARRWPSSRAADTKHKVPLPFAVQLDIAHTVAFTQHAITTVCSS